MNLLFSATGRQSGKQKVVQSTAQVEREWQMGGSLPRLAPSLGLSITDQHRRGLIDAPGHFQV